MALSNRTLSGCFDPTFASGFTDFLLVQPMVITSSMPNTAINGFRRDITPRNESSELNHVGTAALGCPAERNSAQHCPDKRLPLLHGSFACRFQQCLRILSRIAIPEHGVARHQNFCARP